MMHIESIIQGASKESTKTTSIEEKSSKEKVWDEELSKLSLIGWIAYGYKQMIRKIFCKSKSKSD